MKINTQNLSKRFNREWIFRNLNHTFTGGNTYAITGPNGSGKSTLLQVLWGQMPQSTGQLEYSFANQSIDLDKVYLHVAIATPYLDLIEEFTLAEQLEFHFKLKRSRNGMTVDQMIEKLYLQNSRDKQISNFSSGMKQRVKLALAFYTEAQCIFLDEPGTNLDKQAFEWYLSNLEELPRENMVFIASNQSEEYPGNAIKINILEYK